MRTLHVTAASALFILSSFVGLWFSVGILPRYIAAYRATLKVRDPGDRRLAEGLHFEIMVGEAIRCILHALFLIAGLWSLTIAPAPFRAESLNQRWFGVYFLWTLVTANVGLTINTLTVRRGYRTRRGARPAKLLPERAQFAGLLMRVRRLEGRITAEESRNDAVEQAAATAYERADRAESRADQAHDRADAVDVQQGVQDERIEITEDVLEITHTITKKTDGAE